MARTDKLSKLVALYDYLHSELTTVEDERALQLCESWKKARPIYAEPTGGHPRSALATGMEQGLRETPMLLKLLPLRCGCVLQRRSTVRSLPISLNSLLRRKRGWIKSRRADGYEGE